MDEPILSAGPTRSKLLPMRQLGLHSGWEGAWSVGPRPACLRRADFREHGTRGRAEVCALESQGFTLVTMQYCHRRGCGAWGGELEGHVFPPRQDLGAQKSRFPVNVLFAPLFPLLQKAFFPAVTWGARTIPPFLPPPPLPGPPVLSLHSSHLRLDGHRAGSPGHGSLTVVVSLWARLPLAARQCPPLSLINVGVLSTSARDCSLSVCARGS